MATIKALVLKVKTFVEVLNISINLSIAKNRPIHSDGMFNIFKIMITAINAADGTPAKPIEIIRVIKISPTCQASDKGVPLR